jgi:muramoyltetrapeptide carboxypeptidase LdcA involved in peptidoglycan recycling
MIRFRVLAVSNYAEKTNDIVRAVGLLRRHGVAVGFPMQTADGDVIFSVGKDTLTADELLELLERDELDAEGLRKSVEALALAMPTRRQAASS